MNLFLETFDSTFTVEATGDRGEFSMTKVYLTENTEAAAKINAFLEEGRFYLTAERIGIHFDVYEI